VRAGQHRFDWLWTANLTPSSRADQLHGGFASRVKPLITDEFLNRTMLTTDPHAQLRHRLRSLADGSHVVIDDFLAPDEIAYWRSLAALKHKSGEMRVAAIGRGDKRLIAHAIRNDRIIWIEPDPRQPIEVRLARKLEGLRRALNEKFLLGLFDLELHLAIYPPGGFYAAHVDRFHDDDRRIVSVIVYLNNDWSADDGGALRIWSGTREDRGQSVDIAPVGGRLVLFWSDVTLHEVTATARDRSSLTGWFRRRE
jgi:SM-20-related protein